MRLPDARTALTAGLAVVFGLLGIALAGLAAVALGALLWWAGGGPL